jgi:predicted RNA polymerase sigma factor
MDLAGEAVEDAFAIADEERPRDRSWRHPAGLAVAIGRNRADRRFGMRSQRPPLSSLLFCGAAKAATSEPTSRVLVAGAPARRSPSR